MTGHLCSVSFREAVGLGIDNIEHGFLTNSDYVEEKEHGVCPPGVRQSLLDIDLEGEAVQTAIREMVEANVAWNPFWVIFGIVGWTIATVVGLSFVGPELGRIDEAAQSFGPESDEVRHRVTRLFAVFRFDTALLMLIVIVMTIKPKF